MKQQNTDDVFQDLNLDERKTALLDQGATTARTIVNRPFTDGELTEFKNQLSEEMIVLNKVGEELSELKKAYKQKMKPMKKVVSQILTDLRLKFRESEETVYLLADYNADTMNTYDEHGRFIASRKLYPQERQTKIIELKTGTNN